MLEEDYCSFEVAKLLKEKGFDECIFEFYEGHKIKYARNGKGFRLSELGSDIYYPHITYQMAMKWLREVHQLHISVDVRPIYGKVKDEKGRNTCGLLYWYYIASGEWMNNKYNPQQKAFVVSAKSYEEAVEAALKYSLENLI